MEHLITIAFDFDDKAVSDRISKTVEEKVTDTIVKDVEKKIFDSGWRQKPKPDSDPLSWWTENIVMGVLDGYKDAIIERAAELLVNSYKRTKAWKEAAGEAVTK